MGVVEALYIFDEHNNSVLQHVYTGRPPLASTLMPSYLAAQAPRPSLLYLPNLNPPTLLFSLLQDRLLFLAPVSSDIEPLLVIEFLHRVADALEEFLGSPLLASKIEANYDVVAQIAGEMCDAGSVCNTEPNALREVVEVPNWLGSLLGGLELPGTTGRGASSAGIQRPASPFTGGIGSLSNTPTSFTGSAIPWRRSNVRHTSNELYVDIVETLSVIVAPSGRPISAFANGTIAFTAKISGVPDLLLTLTAPGGKAGIQNVVAMPTFHPCVRLARWREHPGELSFVPPDGRFILAGYECNLLPELFASADFDTTTSQSLNLPATVELMTSLGLAGDEFEVRLNLNRKALNNSTTSSNKTNSGAGRFANSSPAFGLSSNNVQTAGPAIEELVVTIPISAAARNVSDIRPNRGEANYIPSEGIIEWRIASKEAALITHAGITLRCTIVGEVEIEAGQKINGFVSQTNPYEYDESAMTASYQTPTSNGQPHVDRQQQDRAGLEQSQRVQKNSTLMPQSATLSFSVKGWLASGVKVDSLTINTKTSKGLGAGVSPYKGVKYHTVSRQGVEVRC